MGSRIIIDIQDGIGDKTALERVKRQRKMSRKDDGK